jgi:hypothetical protein
MLIKRRNLQNPSQTDILDRILDKGIVIDAWSRVSLAGLELVTMESRVVVASIQTYLERAATDWTDDLGGSPSRRAD